eukprot:1042307-Amorphochlora_amoeboformis.AAC.2
MASAHDDVEIARYLKDLSSFSMARLEQIHLTHTVLYYPIFGGIWGYGVAGMCMCQTSRSPGSSRPR